MTISGLHVVFGTGQVGAAVAARLAGLGATVRAVSRHQPPGLADGVEWCAVDVRDPESAIDTAAGASVVYQCLNAPYTKWPQQFPPLQRAVLGAAEHAQAVLVTLENVYGYGPTGGAPLTEELPLAATTVKGRARVAMTRELFEAQAAGRVQIAIGRSSDYFGPGVTASSLGERFFANAVAGRRVDFLGNPDLLHTYSYVPDVAEGLVTLGTDSRALGQVWHLPSSETVTTRAVLDLVARRVGHPAEIRHLAPAVLHALALVSPMMRELAEIQYQFEEPLILDTSKYESTFTTVTTPLEAALSDTLAWYQARRIVS